MSTPNTTRAPVEKKTPKVPPTTTERLSLGQVLRFYLCSGMAAATNLGVRYLLSVFAGLSFAVAVTLAYLAGMAVNYLLNKRFTFPEGPRRSLQEVRSFIAVALFGLLLVNLFAIALLALIQILPLQSISPRIQETLAHGSSVVLVSVYSLLAHKYFTFDKGLRHGLKRLLRRDADR